jgi:hypothetical protein
VEDSWSKSGDFPGDARTFVSAVSESQGAIVAGGFSETGELVSQAYYFDVWSDAWIQLDNAPLTTRGMEGFCLNNQIYFVGGLAPFFTRVDGVQRYSFENIRIDPLVRIWPVPARLGEQIYLEVSDLTTNGSIEIFDIKGVRIYSEPLISGQTFLSLSTLDMEDGVYFIRVSAGEINTIRKIVITR